MGARARTGGVALLASALLLAAPATSALGGKGGEKGPTDPASRGAQDAPGQQAAHGGGQGASQREAGAPTKATQPRSVTARSRESRESKPKPETSKSQSSQTRETSPARSPRSTATAVAAPRAQSASPVAVRPATGLRSTASPTASALPRHAETPARAVAGGPSERLRPLGRRGARDGTPPPATTGRGAVPRSLGVLDIASVPRLSAAPPLPRGERTPVRTGSERRARPVSFLPSLPSLAPISRVVEVVPLEIWLALGGLALLSLLSTGVAAATTASARRTRRLARRAERDAVTDPLTGLLNRRGLELRLDAELERARRYGRSVAVAYVDVDGLKSVNDGHGHGSGDTVLSTVADALRAGTRDGDLVARVGGDEFMVALVEQDAAGAKRFADRLRARVRLARAQLGLVSPWDVTVGVAAFPGDGASAAELIEAADRRLYAQRGIEISVAPPAEAREPALSLVG